MINIDLCRLSNARLGDVHWRRRGLMVLDMWKVESSQDVPTQGQASENGTFVCTNQNATYSSCVAVPEGGQGGVK